MVMTVVVTVRMMMMMVMQRIETQALVMTGINDDLFLLSVYVLFPSFSAILFFVINGFLRRPDCLPLLYFLSQTCYLFFTFLLLYFLLIYSSVLLFRDFLYYVLYTIFRSFKDYVYLDSG